MTHKAAPGSLPDRCFVQIEGSPYLVLGKLLLLWTPAGYPKREKRHLRRILTVLTPKPAVECFWRGYNPEVHQRAPYLSVLK